MDMAERASCAGSSDRHARVVSGIAKPAWARKTAAVVPPRRRPDAVARVAAMFEERPRRPQRSAAEAHRGRLVAGRARASRSACRADDLRRSRTGARRPRCSSRCAIAAELGATVEELFRSRRATRRLRVRRTARRTVRLNSYASSDATPGAFGSRGGRSSRHVQSLGILVLAPAEELRAVAEAVALHLVVAHLDDELRPDRGLLELAGPPAVRLREAPVGRSSSSGSTRSATSSRSVAATAHEPT